MNDFFVFNPQLKKHKKPFGAVLCGERIKLSAYALRTEIMRVHLCIYSEYDGCENCIPVLWEKCDGEYDVFSVEFDAPEEFGILWYCFAIDKTDGARVYFGKNGTTDRKETVMSFQITVYSGVYKTSSWFSEGVTYHVFVDRFNRAKTSLPLKNDPYFYVHKDKGETPYYKPNEKNVVENRDIYGGDIDGIREKLPYLYELGVRTIYLSPVFEAWSNHKYNTADYMKIDSHFGSDESLKILCADAKKLGMRVILDGVFSHTGSDSLYFNREGRYGEGEGAWNNPSSPYRSWFDIDENGKYSSWWGIDTLPQVNELDEEYQGYIINNKVSVISKWMNAGVSGWRLDVADELPDEFIDSLKKRALCETKEAIIIGEVWEDASTKKAYGVNKKYFTQGVLDGVMNYPLKNIIIDFLCGRMSAEAAKEGLCAIIENYPDVSLRCLMNIIGTHDTVRVINELSVGPMHEASKEYRAERSLSNEEYQIGKTRLYQAAMLQYMFPGSPCIYYGDEVGMQGFEDPFNRRYFTWDNIDEEILSFYKSLGRIKTEYSCMHNGMFKVIYAKGDVLAVSREDVVAFINRGNKTKLFAIPEKYDVYLKNGKCCLNVRKLMINAQSCCLLIRKDSCV